MMQEDEKVSGTNWIVRLMAMLLQILDTLMALANAVWFGARLLVPREMTRMEATAIFLPICLIGLILVWVGRSLADQWGKV